MLARPRCRPRRSNAPAARLAHAILHGTLIPIARVADQQPNYFGKHKRHGVNELVLADPAGRLIWALPALPGSTHDLTAAPTHGLIDALTRANVMNSADKGYQGAGGTAWTPFNAVAPACPAGSPSTGNHAKTRALGERAVATLKGWMTLTKLHRCPRRATAIVQAILVLQAAEDSRYPR